MYDVVVIGLGPAGSTVARILAKAGLNVVAVDKETFPRYKSCGGCISTKVEGLLDFDISGVVEQDVYGASFTYKCGREMDIVSDERLGYNVMRDRFDTLLVEKAKEAGAEVIEGQRVLGASDNGQAVRVRLEDKREIEARLLVGADGALGFVGRELFGLDPKQCAVSVTAEVPYDRRAHPEWNKKLFIDFGSLPYGYGWIFPKEKYLSVGMAGDHAKSGKGIKAYFDDMCRRHPALKGLKIDSRMGWSVPVYYSSMPRVVKGRALLVGDAGHLVDPFLGEGIYYAILTATYAARAIIKSMRSGEAVLDEYTGWLDSVVFAEFKAAEKLSDLVYNHPRLWYSLLEGDKSIMLRYYDVIRGRESAGSFLSWVFSKVKSKPWQVIRGIIASRFMGA